ncbi:hypothetical protein LXL04_028944 [Taraxacum kok-saghyz]
MTDCGMLVQVRTIIKFENGGTNLDRYKSHWSESNGGINFGITWLDVVEIGRPKAPFFTSFLVSG